MTRTSGSINSKDYRYKVLINGEVKYFISQLEIQQAFNLKRTAVYYLINSPIKIKRKVDLKIEKLENTLPVYIYHRQIDDFGGYIMKCQKIVY